VTNIWQHWPKAKPKTAGHVKIAQSKDQGCQIGFLTPNLTNLAFLEAIGVKKIVGSFSSIFGFF